MDTWDKSFKELFLGMMIIGFVMLFWSNFKLDMERRYGIKSTKTNNTQNVQPGQVVRQQLYPAGYNNGGPATVYYRQF